MHGCVVRRGAGLGRGEHALELLGSRYFQEDPHECVGDLGSRRRGSAVAGEGLRRQRVYHLARRVRLVLIEQLRRGLAKLRDHRLLRPPHDLLGGNVTVSTRVPLCIRCNELCIHAGAARV